MNLVDAQILAFVVATAPPRQAPIDVNTTGAIFKAWQDHKEWGTAATEEFDIDDLPGPSDNGHSIGQIFATGRIAIWDGANVTIH